MDNQTNAVNWFEIPVADMQRARHFYQVIFSVHLDEANMDGMEMVMFPAHGHDGKVGGALVKGPYNVPSMQGSTIYLNANPDMSAVLEKVEAEGGQVLMPKTLIDEQTGYMAFIADTEGNRVGLHSQQ